MDVSPDGRIEELYRAEGNRLWRAVWAYAGDREVASDAVAEAFAQLLRRGAAVREVRGWVWRTAFRIAAGELADRRRRTGGETKEGTYEDADPADDLVQALRHLSPKQRGAVVLHHYAGYSAREIASMIGSTGPAVRVHLSQGRKRLRELLRESDDE